MATFVQFHAMIAMNADCVHIITTSPKTTNKNELVDVSSEKSLGEKCEGEKSCIPVILVSFNCQ